MFVLQESKGLLPPLSLLDSLTPDDARQLVIAEDELATSRRYNWQHRQCSQLATSCSYIWLYDIPCHWQPVALIVGNTIVLTPVEDIIAHR